MNVESAVEESEIPSALKRNLDALVESRNRIIEVRQKIEAARAESPSGLSRILGRFSSDARQMVRDSDQKVRELSELCERMEQSESDTRVVVDGQLDEYLRKVSREYCHLTDKKVSTGAAHDHWESVKKRIVEVISAIGEAKNQMCHAYSRNKQFSPASLRTFAQLLTVLQRLAQNLSEFERRVERLQIPALVLERSEIPRSEEIERMARDCERFGSSSYNYTYKLLESWVEGLDKFLKKGETPTFIRKADEQVDQKLKDWRRKFIYVYSCRE